MDIINYKQKIDRSNHEFEESADEYMFCDPCGDYVFEYCAIHGPLLVIPDTEAKVKTRSDIPDAALSIPNVFLHISLSNITGAGLGVFATLTLPRGVRFGPYKGQHASDVKSAYCWQIHNNYNQPIHVVDAADPAQSNWMRYINCARHYTEQNLVAYQYQGEIYYRTIKIIPRFTELLVYYGTESACSLRIDLNRYNVPFEYEPKSYTTPMKFSGDIYKKPEHNDFIRDLNKGENTTIKLNVSDNDSTTSYESNVTAEQYVSVRLKEDITNEVPEPLRRELDESFQAEKYKTNYIEMYSMNDFLTKNPEDLISHHEHACFICEGKFNDKRILAEHIKTHSEIERKTCRICKTKFKETRYLKRHIVRIHIKKYYRHTHTFHNHVGVSKINEDIVVKSENENIIDCNVFQETVQESQEGGINSKNTLQTENEIKCPICSKVLQKKYLQKHVKSIHNNDNKEMKCSMCSKVFKTSYCLKRHVASHMGLKKWKCSICDTGFTKHIYLQQHVINKHGTNNDKKEIKKEIKCSMCNKVFKTSYCLKRHVASHIGLKKWKCSVCDTGFTKQVYLQQHFINKHGTHNDKKEIKKEIKCSMCSKVYMTRYSLKRHFEKIHKS